MLTLYVGDMCGSVCLDQAFEKHIRAVVGDKVIDGMKVHGITLLPFLGMFHN